MGCARAERKADAMQFKPMEQLVADIRRSDTPPRSGGGDATSYPIPVRSEGRVLVAAFEYEAGYDIPKRTNHIGPPSLVRFFDPATGARVREEKRPAAAALGTEAFDVPRAEYRELLPELYRAYDVLLPAFARGDAKPAPEVRTAAKSYQRAFARVSGKLLLPYYREIGKDWFTWIDAAAADPGGAR
jgi:hypothetical protein